MVKSNKRKFSSIFKDREGRVVIWQSPNFLLVAWAFCRLITFVVNANLEIGFSRLGSAFLFAWAYLEVRSGVNIFRRILGLIVACVTIWSFFQQL